MIFEANYTIVKKALTTIQNTLTGTEWNRPEFTNIELHVEDDEVYISYQGETTNQLEYQFNIADAEPILEGHLLINLRELLDVIKSFNKDAGTLLFERDGMELRVDDGVYEPELIVLSDENNLDDGFNLVSPTQSITLPKSWLAQRMEIARINNKTTFLDSTSDVAFFLKDNMIQLRSFNLTSLYETKLVVEHSLEPQLFLLGKTASSRLSRLLKTFKEDEIQLYVDNTSMYVFTDEMVFRFYGEEDVDGKAIYESLPIEGMAESVSTASFKTTELKKLMKIQKGEETPESIGLKWADGEVRLDVAEPDSDEIFPYHYPFKSVQKIASKWMSQMELSLGLKENNDPLIIKKSTTDSEDVLVLMGLEPLVGQQDQEHEIPEEKIA